MAKPLEPSAQLLIKLGSIIVHADELMSPDGHPFDKIAFEELMRDPQVVAWIAEMNSLALLPLKRNAK
jgi:hypothetical protein